MQVLAELFTYSRGEGALQVKLAHFIDVGVARCSVSLLREGVSAGAPEAARLKQVPLDSNVGTCLREEMIVEFPRFVVVTNAPASRLPDAPHSM
jgi:hypothetical protein